MKTRPDPTLASGRREPAVDLGYALANDLLLATEWCDIGLWVQRCIFVQRRDLAFLAFAKLLPNPIRT
jgi:hypothetical protein